MLKPLIIGHRGASSVAPENTLAAFERAIAEGADGIEFDVQLARDGVPVVIHDATLKRTARRAGLIAQLSSIELGRVDVGTWFNLRFPARAQQDFSHATIPKLSQVLNLFRDTNHLLYIEMKCAFNESRPLAEEVARLIHEHNFSERAIVESFLLEAIQEIKRVDKNIRTAALFEPKLARPFPSKRALVERARRFEADEIALHRSLCTARAVEEATACGLPVVVWTADHPSWVGRAVKQGIHAIITNTPARLCAERERLSAAQSDITSDTLQS